MVVVGKYAFDKLWLSLIEFLLQIFGACDEVGNVFLKA